MDHMINQLDIAKLNGTTEYPSSEQIGFVGPSSGGNKIRAEFEGLESSDIIQHLSDIGDIDRKSLRKVGELLHEFVESIKCTVICTPSYVISDLTEEFWNCYANPVVITNKPLGLSLDLSYIGIQRHLYPTGFIFESNKHIRLGEARNNIERTEVILRNADCVLLDLNALRLSDNIGSMNCSTAGLLIEEFCMIAKYAGASSNVKTIIINGYDQNRDIIGMMAKNIALALFYVLDGYDIRQRENQASEQLQRYTVLPDNCDEELVFVEDQRSGRWWVELFSEGAEKDVKMACSKQDYEDACNNVISERLTSLLSMA